MVFFIFRCSISTVAENQPASESIGGLYFHSHQVIKDKRTSLKIGNKEPVIVNKGLNLEFYLNLRDERSVFGYVCRVVANDTMNIDILSSNFEGEDALWLVFGNEKKQLILLKDVPDFKKGKWVKVCLSYLPLSKTIEMSLNSVVSKIKLSDKSLNYNKFEIYFGVNNHPRFFTSDAAPIIIKDVVISDHTGKNLFHWTLREHGAGNVVDIIRKSEAKVENPYWLADEHIHWELFDSITINTKPLLAFNETQSHLYIVNTSRMYVFDLLHNQNNRDTIEFKAGKPFETLANQLIYNKFFNELWSYDLDGTGLSKYNFSNNTWSINGKKPIEPSYWHHNSVISPVDSTLICFGGYGYYTYHSIIQRYRRDLLKWEKKSLINQIQPRYLSAATIYGNEMYVFGGFGNKTGEQQLSPHSFCDLYAISLPDLHVTKKWELNNIFEGMVYSQSLIIDRNETDFYVLGYYGMRFNTWIQLYKLRKDKPGMLALGDSIPYQFSDTESFCDLYFIPENNSFVAATVHRNIQNKYHIKLYRLNYPALPVEDIIQPKDYADEFTIKNIGVIQAMLILAVFLLLGVAIGVFVISSRKKRNKRNQINDIKSAHGFDYLNTEDKLYEIKSAPSIISSSISLIGGFQAINKNGVDITAQFTPTIRYLVLLIILHTYKSNKGISSAMLDEILWFDKSETSARNNRNVNINKLRSILEEFDGFEINNDNSYWHAIVNPPFFCDYILVLDFARKIASQKTDTLPDELDLFVSLVSQGLLLPNIQTEWVDTFKAEFTSLVIDTLQILAKQAEKEEDYKTLLKLSDAMLIQDSIDEDALVFKCKSLIALGKKSTALSFYNNFCRNYKLILNDEFPVPFSKLV
ncbi:MAG: hypothetical protein VB102_02955 [Paludibacter sp.]|nr:hypothetical protein [Paludibacter sp.]